MNRKSLITACALALTLAALLAAPAWLGAADSSSEDAAAAPATRGYLGVGLRELTTELQVHFGAPEGSGVLVASVSDPSPAAAAGIRVGDVITAVDGLAVDSARDLSREIRHRPGDAVTIELSRDGQPRRLSATLGEKEARHWGPGDWSHGGRTPEEWAEFGERWGEEFAQRWGEEHAESWQRWAEEMAERGEGWEEMGEEIGRAVEKALAEVDWDEIGRSIEESMKAIEGIDWEEMSAEIESSMAEVHDHLRKQQEKDTDTE